VDLVQHRRDEVAAPQHRVIGHRRAEWTRYLKQTSGWAREGSVYGVAVDEDEVISA
jgi:hypothetical protein